MLTSSTIISTVGIVIILLYCLKQIADFYDIRTNGLKTYLVFYIFLIISVLLLHTKSS